MNHVYLTASINEPGGMHHIEGGLCGLPILYRKSGSLPEYCKNFGVCFDGTGDIINSLEIISKNYNRFKKKMKLYNRTSEKMCSEYYDLFIKLQKNKVNLLKNRNLIKNHWLLFRNQIPI